MTFQEFKDKYEHKKVEEQLNQVSAEPVVSVCVQTYQHAPYIKECLDGILMQETDFPFEILLGEDGSTDGTREICMEYAEKYPDKIRLFLHHRKNNIKINGVPTGRFNFLYNLYTAKGRYIALCEGDDYWTDSLKLQKQVEFLEKNSDHILCVGGFKKYNVNTGGYEEIIKCIDNRKVNYSFRLEDTLSFWLTKTLTALFRNDRRILNQLMKYEYGRDVHLFYHLLKLGKGYYFTNIFGVYRMHEGGIHSLQQKKTKFAIGYIISKELYEINKDNYTRYSYFRIILKLLNLEIYKKEHDNFFVKKRQLFKIAISLLRKPKEFILLTIILIPPHLKLKLKEFIPRYKY